MSFTGRTPPRASPANQMIGMVISTVLLFAYMAFMGSWTWALGVVVGVFVHEYGHVLAMNGLGMGPASFRIVPFLGGAATPARPAPTEFKDALVALAGPAFGLLAVLPFIALAGMTQSNVWLNVALPVPIINLLNLIPAPPLDGSRALGPVLAKIHPQFERAVLILVGAIAVLWSLRSQNFLIAAFIGIAVIGTLKRPSIRPWAIKMNHSQQLVTFLLYFAVAGLCVATLAVLFQLMGGSMFGVHLFLMREFGL